jgi:hypothetical protein
VPAIREERLMGSRSRVFLAALVDAIYIKTCPGTCAKGITLANRGD